tara:strand:+ start:89 stop:649 length:561 start_codon:yes stop_codon:yes gene_type:complete
MASVVEICSNALNMLGDDAISSLDEDNDRARLCKAFYDTTRDATLRAHPWNCALVYSEFSQLSAGAGHTWDYAYQLPSEPYCLRVWQAQYPDIKFRVVGRQVYTDESSFLAIYISRVTDPALFDASLYMSLTARMAWAMAYPLTKSRFVMEQMRGYYGEQMRIAKADDGQEGTPNRMQANILAEVR